MADGAGVECASPLTDEPDLARLIDVLVRRLRPVTVFLFGSHASGQSGADSDIDLLLIVDADDAGPATEVAYVAVAEVATEVGHRLPPVDVVVLTSSEWSEYSRLPGHLAFTVRRKGVVLHGRAA